jgi:HEAT repeat protein
VDKIEAEQMAHPITIHASNDLIKEEENRITLLPEDLNDIEALIEALLFGSEEVRPAARASLVAIGSEVSAKELLKALGLVLESDEVDEVSLEELCLALKETGESAFQVLLQALKSKRTNIPATYALGRVGDRRAVEPLLELLNSNQPRLQARTAVALADLQDQRSVAPLTELFNTSSNYVSVQAAAMALARLGAFDPLLEKLKNEAASDVQMCFWNVVESSDSGTNSSRRSLALKALSLYAEGLLTAEGENCC